MEVNCHLQAAASFTSGKRSSCTNWLGGWLDPMEDLDVVEKGRISSPVWNRTLVART